MSRIVISIVAACAALGCSYDGSFLGPATPGDAEVGDGGMSRGATTTDGIPADESMTAGRTSEDVSDPSGGASPSPEAAASCFDGVDNDMASADGFDCGDPDCAGIASCVVGNGSLCTAISDDSLAITGCAELPVTTDCIGGVAEPFGSPSPWVADGALHPGGDDADSGIIYEQAVGLRSHRLALRATLQQPTCLAGDPCLDTVALGVTGQPKEDLAAGNRVHAHVALAYSAARSAMSLLLSDTVVQRWPITPSTPDSWTLVLRPDGLLDVLNGDDSLLGTELIPWAPIDDARVVVFGRSMNRAYPSPDGAALTALDVGVSACDMPSAWEERGPVQVGVAAGGSPLALDDAEQVSAVVGGVDGRHYLVYRQAGDAPGQNRFMAAFETTIGPNDYRRVADEPILTPDEVYDEGGIADPELFWDGAQFHLYYTAIEGITETRSIAHASGPELTSLVKDPLPLIAPAEHGFQHLEMPSHARSSGGVDVLVARGIGQSSHELVAFAYLDEVWTRVVGTDPTSSLSVVSKRELDVRLPGRFDADEIAHPSIVRVGGAFHIYYAGRHGTRWGVGLLATDELLYFRDVTGGDALLAGSGEGFDALSTLEPDVLVEDTQVSLFYVGTDGASRTVGRAARSRGSAE